MYNSSSPLPGFTLIHAKAICDELLINSPKYTFAPLIYHNFQNVDFASHRIASQEEEKRMQIKKKPRTNEILCTTFCSIQNFFIYSPARTKSRREREFANVLFMELEYGLVFSSL